ncbi:DUF5688 family protein [Anaerobutyricum soehngenii]|uniref:DUF5688 family protein n=1 Tax=Anaerobutyricum soehngenii TaxID=105843 RepID=UPI003A8A4D56
MLDRYDFFEYVKNNIRDYLPPSYEDAEITITQIPKHNDAIQTSLTIKMPGERFTPNISMEPLYGMYRDGYSMDRCTGFLADAFIEHGILSREQRRSMESIFDYESVKGNLQVLLCDPEDNRRVLQGTVYNRFGDYAATYCITIPGQDGEISSIRVTEDLLYYWQIDKETLHRDALEADRKRGPFLLEVNESNLFLASNGFEMENLLKGDRKLDMNDGMPHTFALTTEDKINGAGMILQEDVMKKTAEVLGRDYFVLPSSIHETIIVSVTGNISVRDLTGMVQQMNETEIDPSIRLSDKVLHYDPEGAYLENAATWEMRAGRAPKKELSDVSRNMQDIVRMCAGSKGAYIALEKYSMPLGRLKAFQIESSLHGLMQYMDFEKEGYDVVCDTRLAECFDLSPEKLKGTEQEQRKQQLKQEEKRIVL